MVDSLNYYDFLGISKDATNYEIRKAYKTKVLHIHPDKIKDPQPSDFDKFHKLQLIKDTLLDTETRNLYDKMIASQLTTRKLIEEMETNRKKMIDELLQQEKQYHESQKIKELFEKHNKQIEGDRFAKLIKKWYFHRQNKAPSSIKRSIRIFWSNKVPKGYFNKEFIRQKCLTFGDVVGVSLKDQMCFVLFKNDDTITKIEMKSEHGNVFNDELKDSNIEILKNTYLHSSISLNDFTHYEQQILQKAYIKLKETNPNLTSPSIHTNQNTFIID
ncbi:hypothetical protein, conserved [Entamoeba dispar SAW760]|uniref:J domain-containing protein n=1 Tax=Entamoeba dispar (strain ATCC PRA-260 / SAW760) TaxID=370354 RepID=B0EUS2_ENTDS|nr:uncharacterized protein EDI_161610 [Entamoeba dispar SAW760]EDR21716.1 hypothetical protein, conserved [Entamoeba dispar SAW760]|eukprot:EDR21716.1 hypothetical protein, conserved [Entamoeba dispar SAW760]